MYTINRMDPFNTVKHRFKHVITFPRSINWAMYITTDICKAGMATTFSSQYLKCAHEEFFSSPYCLLLIVLSIYLAILSAI